MLQTEIFDAMMYFILFSLCAFLIPFIFRTSAVPPMEVKVYDYASLNQLTEAVGTQGAQGTGEGAGDNQSADNRSAPEPEGCDEKD